MAIFAGLVLGLLVVGGAQASSADYFHTGTFKGPTSQIGPFGLFGKRVHGDMYVYASQGVSSQGHAVVTVAPAWQTTSCTPNGDFHTDGPFSTAMRVSRAGHFQRRLTSTWMVVLESNGEKLWTHVTAYVTGQFVSSRRVTGTFRAVTYSTTRPTGGRVLQRCALHTITYSASRR